MAPVATSSPSETYAKLSVKEEALLCSTDEAPATLIDALKRARKYSQQTLSFISSQSQDLSVKSYQYADFIDSTYRLAQAMSDWGRPEKSVVVVYLTEHEDNMAAVWACLLCGLIPCLQPSLSSQDDHRQDHIAHIQRTLSSPIWLTNEAGIEQIGTKHGVDIRLMTQLRLDAKTLPPRSNWALHSPKPDDDAMLFLTSGSTGFSKVVVHTHRTLIAAAAAKGAAYGLTTETRILNWVGFDHVAGSIEMHITPFVFGAFQLHVHASVIMSSSEHLLSLIDTHKIDFTFAPNFLFAKVIKDFESKTPAAGKFDLTSLKRINSGGEAVVATTAIRFVKVLKYLSRQPNDVSIIISPGFGMTETCAGCIYNPVDMSSFTPVREFLDLGYPNAGLEMRIVDPEHPDVILGEGQSGELQIRGPMLFTRYYNNTEATSSSILPGGWYRSGDLGIIENGSLRLSGRIKDTIIVHGVSHGIPELETHLQNVPTVAPSYLAVSPYRAPGSDTESFIVFYSPTFDLFSEDSAEQLSETHRALRDICTRMITLPPAFVVPIPVSSMEKTTLGKLSRAQLLKKFQAGVFAQFLKQADALLAKIRSASFVQPDGEVEAGVAKAFAGIFDIDPSTISATDNFFELGGTSIDIIRLKRELEQKFSLPELPIISVLRHPVLRDLAKFVTSVQGGQIEYQPVVPLQLTGSKTPIFFVHPGVGEVLIFVNLAKYFQNERPFYAIRARGFDEGQPMFETMKEMVTTYADAVMSTQTKGPYAIAGYSYGGVVAFEVAKVIESRGEEVKFVGLVNIPPHIKDRMHEITNLGGMLNLSYFLGLLTKAEALDLETRLTHLTFKEQIDYVWKIAPAERIEELQLTPAKLEHWVAIARSLIECGKDYDPSGSVSSLDVFYAIPLRGSKEDWLNKQLHPWKEYSRGEPSFTDVPGQHYTLMDIDHVSQFQKFFRARLEARGL